MNEELGHVGLMIGIGIFVILIFFVVLPIVVIRWLLRIDEMVKYQKKTVELLDRIYQHLTKTKEA